MEKISRRHLLRHELQTRKHLLRNYLAHAIEGGLYMGGMAFLSEITVLPVMVKSLDGPLWLLSAMPVLAIIGFWVPSLLVAHWVERLYWLKRYIVVTGIYQRLPYLLTGLAMLALGPSHPAIALAAVALCPLLSGLAGGLSQAAWLEIIAKTIPPQRRSSLWAARSLIAAGIGAIAGGFVLAILKTFPGTEGFGILHLITFGFMVASLAVFLLIRETDLPPRPGKHTTTLMANLRAVPSMIRGNKLFRQYLLAHVLSAGQFVVLPFIAIHALGVLDKPESFVGVLVIAQMIGGASGNVLAGYVGDRLGGRILLVLGRAALIGVLAFMVLSSEMWHFLGAFGLLGAMMSFISVGVGTLGLEVCPLDKRSTYLSIVGMAWVLSLLLASAVAAITWALSGGSFICVAAIAAAGLAASVFFVWRLRDPRAG